MKRPFVLINSNVIKPPVSPVGLEYVAESLSKAGFEVDIIDLAMEKDWKQALSRLSRSDALAVGMTFRNTDDCSFYSRKYFIPWGRELVKEVKRHTSAPVIMGGVGYSIFPEPSLLKTGADFGIEGDGEEAMVMLALTLAESGNIHSISNLVFRNRGLVVKTGRKEVELQKNPPFSRSFFNNLRYEKEGAMVGVETKRGCPEPCIYCADPVAKGSKYRLRPPEFVTEEIKNLVNQGVSWLHLCDSEFNMPLSHAKEVCKAIIRKGSGNKINWYCYCSPVSFDAELAGLMKKAGCAGINFGVDSLVDSQLAWLGRKHRLQDVERLVNILKKEELNYIFDLLLGGMGENEDTIRSTIQTARSLDIPLVGISLGIRLYPGTPLVSSDWKERLKDGFQGNSTGDLSRPAFYLSPALGDKPAALINHYASGDSRFLLLAEPGEKGSYNYAGDNFLHEAILKGARGAYWDILSKTMPNGF